MTQPAETERPRPLEGARERRAGRGRASTVDLLPEEELELVAAQLRDKSLPQSEILAQLNHRLAAKGLRLISKGAFSRWSVRAAIEARKLEASRAITEAVLGRLRPGEVSDSTLAVTELLKLRLLELVMGDDEPDADKLAAATLALARLDQTQLRQAENRRREGKHQRAEAEHVREAAERQARDEREAAAAEAAERAATIAGEAGLGADRIAAIRKGVLGLAG